MSKSVLDFLLHEQKQQQQQKHVSCGHWKIDNVRKRQNIKLWDVFNILFVMNLWVFEKGKPLLDLTVSRSIKTLIFTTTQNFIT